MISNTHSFKFKENPTICVMGLGYVGLPTALHFAKSGYNIIGFDIDTKKIEMLKKGKLPFFDVGLDVNFEKAKQTERIIFTSDEKKINESDIVIVVVPTPVDERKVPDLSYIIGAGEIIGRNLQDDTIIVLESTVYPGTTEEVLGTTIEKISGKKVGHNFHLAYVPERYNPGDPEHTLVKVNRVVGGSNEKVAKYVAKIYGKIIEADVIVTRNIKTAEAAKVIENTQRDLNIALMNELALICERLGIDVMDVIEAAQTKWNFGKYYPGAGVGGHCLPHDPYYLTMKAKELGFHPEIILAGRRLNDSMPLHMVELVQDSLNNLMKSIKESKILLLGASYKAETGDLRSTPTEVIAKELAKKGAKLYIVDPFIDNEKLWDIPVYNTFEDKIVKDIDCIVLITNHSYFDEESLLELKKKIDNDNVVFVDGRRTYNPEKMSEKYYYRGLGDGLRRN
ncbi:MAG: nucleotide sugar dehydrogenase [Candidatus Heimdallarchaeaceae archaeon]